MVRAMIEEASWRSDLWFDDLSSLDKRVPRQHLELPIQTAQNKANKCDESLSARDAEQVRRSDGARRAVAVQHRHRLNMQSSNVLPPQSSRTMFCVSQRQEQVRLAAAQPCAQAGGCTQRRGLVHR